MIDRGESASERHEDLETMKCFVIACFVAALLPPTGAFTQDSGQERVAVGNRITLVAGSASGSHCNLSPARAAGVGSYSDWRLSRGTRVGYRWPMPIRKDSAWSGTRPCRDNVVFAATTEVYLIALDAINGRLLWRSDTDALESPHHPSVTQSTRQYVVSIGHRRSSHLRAPEVTRKAKPTRLQ